ncbi:phosphoribosylformylglycinamidine cyclo-ligase [Sulfolobus sp. A20]|uniref:phosphoribosylformylglycinamidine cyclo-ligase n=1 Tax=Sulfolobaceae TaxID=118883 RepID=UPI000846135A|nr:MULTISPECIES: phosphoribosylformylglycinamidine cyclo-ligase [unclassified Sulfolobus]TRM75566.1 phosphoribosylformylglycinamidine cyclo-ligase [Sulfolobus sp. A20-N-F8]TRM80668.1 phosphoribosylformylglycinamidine cyclo-ligase [Sulfolobus sp. D5]TRM89271.1 phosphoribosylformylglycinamidine cyclo-ligase [Sulfolobus sp. C3]TRM94472.1 phosphoribosylformylglycinamidine cyclo-ligase [Sulfolobus sp. A20-N-G8]TRN02553.1 phosphoribosylformylglycinamidine cyclo-ligase [Sulfolobus sp. E1]
MVSEEYKKAGVDLNKLRSYHSVISNAISNTYKNTVLGAGHYAGIIRIENLNIAIHTDGVGTKTLLALKAGIVKPVGIDCVAMNVNDLISVGAKPVALVDYLAFERPMDDVLTQLMEGLVEGAKEANVEIVGGETAFMPDVIKGFDLSCTAIGIVDKLKTGSEIRPGDVVLGLESNGIHANGYSLIRKLVDQGRISLEQYKEQLLSPTKIYVKPVLEVIDKVKGVAHITGGTFTKLKRLTSYKIVLDMPDPPEIFKIIERAGVPHEEMYKIFNMGIGLVLFVSEELSDEVKSEIRKYVNVYEIGKVYEGSGIEIKSYKNVILYL